MSISPCARLGLALRRSGDHMRYSPKTRAIFRKICDITAAGEIATPHVVSRNLGYKLSGYISTNLKKLEKDGLIQRVTHYEGYVEIKPLRGWRAVDR